MKPHEYASIAALPVLPHCRSGCAAENYGVRIVNINNMEQSLAIMEAA